MGMKANAEKVLSGIEHLAEAYKTAKGHDIPQVTITKGQFETVVEAIRKEKIGGAGFNAADFSYKGIKLNLQ